MSVIVNSFVFVLILAFPVTLLFLAGMFIHQEITVYRRKSLVDIYQEALRLYREYPGEFYMTAMTVYGVVTMLFIGIVMLFTGVCVFVYLG